MGKIPVCAVAATLGVLAGLTAEAAASETRGFVVRWFHYANVSEDADCPKGINPGADGTFRRILKERGESSSEIEKKLESFPYSMYEANIVMRGSIDGKSADAYLNPTSTKDPNLHLGEGKKALGFNLDGKDGPKNFVDVETGEKGVDNMFYRAIGCSSQLRSAAGKLPTFPEIQWDMGRDHTPAWLIEIGGIDDYQNDDDVTVTIVRATMPIVRSANGQPQSDMTFTPDPTPRTDGNKVHGKIKNGLLLTGKLEFFMPGEPFSQAEYAFKDARMRFTFLPNGDLKGVIGGYQNWRTIYTSWALGGIAYEVNAGYDVPGLYYALKKTADAYPDPKTGENAYISSAYAFDAIPAFIQHPAAKTAQAIK